MITIQELLLYCSTSQEK